jgi:hypothetical protein
MNKRILIIAFFFFSLQLSVAQTPSKIAFIDWDSIRNQVDLYKINELEIARFKAYIQEIDSLKVTEFAFLSDSISKVHLSCMPSIAQQKAFEELKNRKNIEVKKIELFEELIPKITNEFETKSKEWIDDFFKLKIRYYADSQGFKAVYGINKLLYNRDDFNKKIIELINNDENAKEAQMYFFKFFNNKIKFDYNLD